MIEIICDLGTQLKILILIVVCHDRPPQILQSKCILKQDQVILGSSRWSYMHAYA